MKQEQYRCGEIGCLFQPMGEPVDQIETDGSERRAFFKIPLLIHKYWNKPCPVRKKFFFVPWVIKEKYRVPLGEEYFADYNIIIEN